MVNYVSYLTNKDFCGKKGRTTAIVKGKYSVIYHKLSGKWLLKSQLFVTINSGKLFANIT